MERLHNNNFQGVRLQPHISIMNSTDLQQISTNIVWLLIVLWIVHQLSRLKAHHRKLRCNFSLFLINDACIWKRCYNGAISGGTVHLFVRICCFRPLKGPKVLQPAAIVKNESCDPYLSVIWRENQTMFISLFVRFVPRHCDVDWRVGYS